MERNLTPPPPPPPPPSQEDGWGGGGGGVEKEILYQNLVSSTMNLTFIYAITSLYKITPSHGGRMKSWVQGGLQFWNFHVCGEGGGGQDSNFLVNEGNNHQI